MGNEVGRNDPCPCGSGKKYKYCCLPKEEEKRSRNLKPSITFDSVGGIDDNSRNDTGNESWRSDFDKFKELDLDGKFDFFYDKYEDPEEVNGDYALEMLDALLLESSREGQWDDYLSLDREIRENRQDLVEDHRYWLSRGKFLSIIWPGRKLEDEELKELSGDYAQDSEVLSPAFWAFIFREGTENQVDFLRRTNALLHENDDLMIEEKERICDIGIEAEIYRYLDGKKSKEGKNISLQSALKRMNEYYEDLTRERLVEVMAILGGEKSFSWEAGKTLQIASTESQMSLFEGIKGDVDPQSAEESLENYSLLGDQFHRFLHEEKSVLWARGRMARNGLVRYVLGRVDAEFPGEEAKYTTPPRNLIPGPETFKASIEDLLFFLNPQYYRAIAPFIYVGPWLQFLVQQSLIDNRQKEEALQKLETIKEEYREFYEKKCPDPLIMEAFDNWPRVEESYLKDQTE